MGSQVFGLGQIESKLMNGIFQLTVTALARIRPLTPELSPPRLETINPSNLEPSRAVVGQRCMAERTHAILSATRFINRSRV